MNPKLLLSYACERTVLPGGARMFKHFATSLESQHLLIYIFWFIHCKFFQVITVHTPKDIKSFSRHSTPTNTNTAGSRTRCMQAGEWRFNVARLTPKSHALRVREHRRRPMFDKAATPPPPPPPQGSPPQDRNDGAHLSFGLFLDVRVVFRKVPPKHRRCVHAKKQHQASRSLNKNVSSENIQRIFVAPVLCLDRFR